MKSSVFLINHASILISNGKKSILTDPWYHEGAFDDGWNLLFENKVDDVETLLKNLNYIWVSHEHPDHFSIEFFKKYEFIIKSKNITILFQKTKDQRVAEFLKKKNYNFIELDDGKEFEIDNNFSIIIQKNDFYDSALITKLNGLKIFNLNDCPLNEDADIIKFKKKYGTCDFLFTQFSYAAWKGGKKNIEWRRQAADLKIKTIIKQSKILEAKYTIPFASFIYFSDEYNYYLNDSVNKPSTIIDSTKNEKTNFLFLKPYEELSLDSPKTEYLGKSFWEEKFNNIKLEKKIKVSCDYESLQKLFDNYIVRIFKKNSFIFCKILSKISFLKIFNPIVIKLIDLNINCKIDIANKLFFKTDIEPDIEMHSKSLKLIFSQDFGFDTLTINGCFEELKNNGFVKMTQSLALGNLNNLGIFLNFKILFNISVILLFLKKIFNVQKKLTFKRIQEIE